MPIERKNVQHPMWRKKVDASMFSDRCTLIPHWIQKQFDLSGRIESISKNDPDSVVMIQYKRKSGLTAIHSGKLVVTKYEVGRNDILRLFFESHLIEEFKRDFMMTMHRLNEARFRGVSPQKIEEIIPFWEFMDLEFDIEEFRFIMTPHYNLPEHGLERFTYLEESS